MPGSPIKSGICDLIGLRQTAAKTPWGNVWDPRKAVSAAQIKGRGPLVCQKRVAKNPAKLRYNADFSSRSSVMRASPSIAPHGPDHDTYLVLDDFGRIGRGWRETDEGATDRETLIRNLLSGEYNNPVRIVAFNTVEGWSRDVTGDIADELRRRYVEFDDVPESVLAFLEAANRR
jgi:hypothetical protein